MIVEPKIRHNICLTAHPLGCARQVAQQIQYVRQQGPLSGTRKVLVLGASNGYGLAARIVAAFACGAESVGIAYEKAGTEKRPGTAGWYNDRALREQAEAAGLGAWSINGDAFSEEIKSQTTSLIEEKMGQVDLVIYSLASPRRKDPLTGDLHSSVLKPIGKPCTSKTVDFQSGSVSEITAEPADQEELRHTVKVMGGEDWSLWIQGLEQAGVLAPGATTVAFSYIGPEVTHAIYREGTIGRAKEHLEATARQLNRRLAERGGRALVSINKALVTRASAVIPAVPLYISLLYRVMKRKGLHEGCIQQMYRLFRDFLYAPHSRGLDEAGRIRLDDLEMQEDVQREVAELWERVNTDNLRELSDIEGFRAEFLRHHGFGMPGVDYSAEVEL